MLAVLAAMQTGCASPGQPKPPSLRLPQIVEDLSAQRIGSTTHLHWTNPSSTTDNLPVPVQMSAVLCRETSVSPHAHGPCVKIAQLAVHPGLSQADDVLPPTLTAEPVSLLAYRIEIFNSAGRSAGRSGEVFVAAGPAPPSVEALVGHPIRRGIRLEWKPEPGSTAVELQRVDLAQPVLTHSGKGRQPVLPASGRPTAEVHLLANEASQQDAGGTIDDTAQKGATYRYTAQRVRTAVLDGHPLELRSASSTPITVKVLDTFPPQPPTGLAAAPGGAATSLIDLSWHPGAEIDLAGYNVYRTEVPGAGSPPAAWQRLNSGVVPVPAFEDSAVRPGTRYRYRITAIDSDGNESTPGNEVQETPGTR